MHMRSEILIGTASFLAGLLLGGSVIFAYSHKSTPVLGLQEHAVTDAEPVLTDSKGNPVDPSCIPALGGSTGLQTGDILDFDACTEDPERISDVRYSDGEYSASYRFPEGTYDEIQLTYKVLGYLPPGPLYVESGTFHAKGSHRTAFALERVRPGAYTVLWSVSTESGLLEIINLYEQGTYVFTGAEGYYIGTEFVGSGAMHIFKNGERIGAINTFMPSLVRDEPDQDAGIDPCVGEQLAKQPALLTLDGIEAFNAQVKGACGYDSVLEKESIKSGRAKA